MKYTTKVVEAICKSLEAGANEKDAGPLNGVAERTYFLWKKETPKFKDMVELSVLRYKTSLIERINKIAEKDGRIALEILKIRWPEEWNPNFKIQLIDPHKELLRTIRLISGEATDEDLDIVNEQLSKETE